MMLRVMTKPPFNKGHIFDLNVLVEWLTTPSRKSRHSYEV